MADSGIEFALKFADQMSGPLKAIGGNLGALEKSLGKMDATLKAMTDAHGAAATATARMGGAASKSGQSMLGAVFGGELLAHAVERVSDAAWEMGKRLVEGAIEATDFGFKAKLAFGSMAGSAAAGEAAFAEAERTARDLAAPVDQVTSSMLALRSAGVKEDWIRPLIAASKDLTIINPRVTLDQAALAMQEIALQGGLSGRTIEMMRSAGVNLDIVAQHLGVHGLHELQERLTKHPLGLYESLRLIQDVIKQQANEPELGALSTKAGASIGGTIQRIKDDWDILLDSINNATAGPMADLRETFARVEGMFREGQPGAEALGAAVDDIGAAINRGLRWLADHPSAIPDAIGEVRKAAGDALDVFKEWAPSIKDFGGDLIAVFGHIKNVYDIAEHLISLLTLGVVSDEKDRWGLGAIGTKNKILPTFDFAPWGKSSTAPVPKMASGGVVTGPTLLVAGEAGPEAIVPLSQSSFSSSRGGDVHAPISVTVHVDGGHASAEIDEQKLATLLEELLPSALISPLERIAATMGAM